MSNPNLYIELQYNATSEETQNAICDAIRNNDARSLRMIVEQVFLAEEVAQKRLLGYTEVNDPQRAGFVMVYIPNTKGSAPYVSTEGEAIYRSQGINIEYALEYAKAEVYGSRRATRGLSSCHGIDW